MRLTIGKKIAFSLALVLALSFGMMVSILDGLYRVKEALREVTEIHLDT